MTAEEVVFGTFKIAGGTVTAVDVRAIKSGLMIFRPRNR
jgi:hypothetical protein